TLSSAWLWFMLSAPALTLLRTFMPRSAWLWFMLSAPDLIFVLVFMPSSPSFGEGGCVLSAVGKMHWPCQTGCASRKTPCHLSSVLGAVPLGSGEQSTFGCRSQRSAHGKVNPSLTLLLGEPGGAATLLEGPRSGRPGTARLRPRRLRLRASV